jgi:hypothetical protein
MLNLSHTRAICNPNKPIARLVVHYPAGAHTVEYQSSCRVNGVQFLTELLKFGWVPASIVGRTLHLVHPAAPYHEA